MKQSDSKWKYVHGRCRRVTIPLTTEYKTKDEVQRIMKKCFTQFSTFNSCVHYFSIKNCVHICHARNKNIETITFGFTGLKKLHECVLNGLNSQLSDRMKSLPVNFRFYRMLKISFSKIFIAPKDSPWNFRGAFRGVFDLRLHLVVDIFNF